MKEKIIDFKIYGEQGKEDIIVLTDNGNLYGSTLRGMKWVEVLLPDLYDKDNNND